MWGVSAPGRVSCWGRTVRALLLLLYLGFLVWVVKTFGRAGWGHTALAVLLLQYLGFLVVSARGDAGRRGRARWVRAARWNVVWGAIGVAALWAWETVPWVRTPGGFLELCSLGLIAVFSAMTYGGLIGRDARRERLALWGRAAIENVFFIAVMAAILWVGWWAGWNVPWVHTAFVVLAVLFVGLSALVGIIRGCQLMAQKYGVRG